jgi:hypothetical protein
VIPFAGASNAWRARATGGKLRSVLDWSTISSLATGAGTLVLAVATFAAVRSSNRSARIAEIALQEQRRPVLTQSRLDDPVQKIMFAERHWVTACGGRGVAEHDGNVYFAMRLRNVGAGIGVCQAWHVMVMPESGRVSVITRLRISSVSRRVTCISRPAISGCGRALCETATTPPIKPSPRRLTTNR